MQDVLDEHPRQYEADEHHTAAKQGRYHGTPGGIASFPANAFAALAARI